MENSSKSLQVKEKSPDPKESPKKAKKESNSKSPKVSKSLEVGYKKIPKNVNDYRHIIDVYYSRESDVEWILDLRGHKKIKLYPKVDSFNAPPFYYDDLNKYKARNNYGDFRKYLKTNISDYAHIYDDKAGLPANSIGVKHITTLRDLSGLKSWKNPCPWKSLSLPKERNLFDTYLPPVTQNGKINLTSLGQFPSRPIDHINSVNIII